MQIIIGTIAVILAFIYGCFAAVFNFFFPDTAVREIRNTLDLNIKSYYVEFHEDTHGWFGDGEEIIIFRPNPEQIEKIESEWQKTPVDSGISPLIFPETEYNGLELQSYINETEGYWIYKNKNDFTSGYSYNIYFAFFDGEIVYYYELDT